MRVERSAYSAGVIYEARNSKAYGITLSSNHAIDRSSCAVYKYIIHEFPESHFYYVKERSKAGKHHIHGIIYLKYSFDYRRLMASKKLTRNYEYDVHIKYDHLKTDLDVIKWIHYMLKDRPKYYHKKVLLEQNLREFLGPPAPNSIPIVRVFTYSPKIHIPGVC